MKTLNDTLYNYFWQLKKSKKCNYQQALNGCGSGCGQHICYIEYELHEVVNVFKYYSQERKREVVKIVASDPAVKKDLEDILDF